MSELRVLMAPYYESNPYQRSLRARLGALGVRTHVHDLLGTRRPALSDGLAAFEPDLLHLHWLHPYFLHSGSLRTRWRARSFLRDLAAARTRGVRVVWTAHNLMNHDRRHVSIDAGVTRSVAAAADAIIAHGDDARERIVEFAGSRVRPSIHVIPHGHYVDDYPNTVRRDAARSELGIDVDAFVLLFFGRVRAYKGVFELLEAYRSAALPPGTILLIAGKATGDRVRIRLKRQAKRTAGVRLDYGFVDDERVQLYFNAADVSVLPYRDILTSGAARLAQSFGKPIVAPAIGCLAEQLDPAGAWLYDPEDPTALSNALAQATQGRERLDAMGAHNRRLVEPWSWDVVARRHDELYRSVVSRA